jgi:hypothetical protein
LHDQRAPPISHQGLDRDPLVVAQRGVRSGECSQHRVGLAAQRGAIHGRSARSGHSTDRLKPVRQDPGGNVSGTAEVDR